MHANTWFDEYAKQARALDEYAEERQAELVRIKKEDDRVAFQNATLDSLVKSTVTGQPTDTEAMKQSLFSERDKVKENNSFWNPEDNKPVATDRQLYGQIAAAIENNPRYSELLKDNEASPTQLKGYSLHVIDQVNRFEETQRFIDQLARENIRNGASAEDAYDAAKAEVAVDANYKPVEKYHNTSLERATVAAQQGDFSEAVSEIALDPWVTVPAALAWVSLTKGRGLPSKILSAVTRRPGASALPIRMLSKEGLAIGTAEYMASVATEPVFQAIADEYADRPITGLVMQLGAGMLGANAIADTVADSMRGVFKLAGMDSESATHIAGDFTKKLIRKTLSASKAADIDASVPKQVLDSVLSRIQEAGIYTREQINAAVNNELLARDLITDKVALQAADADIQAASTALKKAESALSASTDIATARQARVTTAKANKESASTLKVYGEAAAIASNKAANATAARDAAVSRLRAAEHRRAAAFPGQKAHGVKASAEPIVFNTGDDVPFSIQQTFRDFDSAESIVSKYRSITIPIFSKQLGEQDVNAAQVGLHNLIKTISASSPDAELTESNMKVYAEAIVKQLKDTK